MYINLKELSDFERMLNLLDRVVSDQEEGQNNLFTEGTEQSEKTLTKPMLMLRELKIEA